MSNVDLARRYVAAVESGAPFAEIEPFFAPELVQEEYPNLVVKNGITRDLAAIRDAAMRGRQVMTSQRYEILSAIESGDDVALEVQWSGTLAIAFGTIPAGGTMRARLAIFLKFRDGKIVRQHNYDCYDPW